MRVLYYFNWCGKMILFEKTKSCLAGVLSIKRMVDGGKNSRIRKVFLT